MRRDAKVEEVKALSERWGKARAMIFAGYRGLKVSEMTALRFKLREGQSSLKVVKNRLMKRVLKEKGLDNLSDYFKEPTALATSEVDPVTPAKVLVEFAKTCDRLKIKGGFISGALMSIADIETLAKLPSREVLLARALASMNAPASNLVGVLSAMPRKLVYAINAIKDKKQ